MVAYVSVFSFADVDYVVISISFKFYDRFLPLCQGAVADVG